MLERCDAWSNREKLLVGKQIENKKSKMSVSLLPYMLLSQLCDILAFANVSHSVSFFSALLLWFVSGSYEVVNEAHTHTHHVRSPLEEHE